MPVLVDTSVWSLLLRRDQGKLNPKELSAVQSLHQLVADRRARVIGSIRQELLSGIRNADQVEALQHRFRDFEDEALTTADYEVAAEISCKCRRMGIAASAMDSLICAVATLRNWEIFSLDKDFERYRRAVRLRHLPTRVDWN